MKHEPSLHLTVLGPFQAETAAGVCVTPKGAKNQGLLALLALAPNMTRPRRWLEDKLWSTFGPEQASANMRQALSKLRAALGEHADILTADRTQVSLDPRRVRVDLIESVVPEDGRVELLQGIDVRDPEFEEWLRMERQELQARIVRASPTPAGGILINATVQTEDGTGAQVAGEVLANRIGESIAEHVRAWRQDTGAAGHADVPISDVLVSAQITRSGDGHALFVKALHQPSARILYSKLQQIGDLGDILAAEDSVAKTVFEAADQIVGKLPHVLESGRPEARATALSRLALYRMFTFEKDALREAYGLMNQAFSHEKNGVYLAWNSLIRLTQMMEMAEEDTSALQEEAIELHHRAMELDVDNGLVHALVSKVRGTALGDPAGVFDYARTAVEKNPTNAFALKALAEAHLLAGDLDKALALSARARFIARASPFKHYWDTGHCVIAVACNRPQEAIEAGEAAARSAPMSRPALRHLLALYSLEGQYEKASAVAQKLAKIEPGFSLDRIVNDETYPVRTLRNMGLLEPIRALL